MLSPSARRLLDHVEWERVMWQTCSPMTVRPSDGAGFRASLNHWDLGHIGLRLFRAPRYVAVQSPQEIHKAQRQRLVLTIPLEGRCSFSQFGRSVTLEPGQAAFHMTTSPLEYVQQEEGAVVLVQVPSSRVGLYVSCLEDICAIRIEASDRILATLLGSARAVPEIHMISSERAKEAFAEGMVASVGALGALLSEMQDNRNSVVKRRRLNMVKAFIDAELADSGLNPDRIAHANNISVRYLHHLFQGDGQSVTDWIRERRLDQSRKSLESAELRALTVNEIGMRSGFNSDAHFRRAFKTRFGIAPREYRRQQLGFHVDARLS
ncbi:helix-turn-helix domain-containing protein [Kaistia dalseonensis]|uniref:AraC-like DNA-binding protein n=1 Tax=Kaistia dalseonensis TaxID=410840 RepID=A0ABU0HCK5_9HYPH|nr:helix-turn-helix domain-containing protein [Kaistia dalseonensis]MCX5497407.1 helix-turn-helix domain-containing protein [Kaistia dalseonensis]MDQ0440046.1 AraC-like DNA-binding protein [Kaistia dalseonensis]